MSQPATYNFPPCVQGDTIAAKRITVSQDGTPYDLTGVTVRMFLRNSAGALIANRSSGDGLTVAGNEILISAFAIATPGVYSYSIELKFVDGSVKTWLAGSITITTDATHDPINC